MLMIVLESNIFISFVLFGRVVDVLKDTNRNGVPGMTGPSIGRKYFAFTDTEKIEKSQDIGDLLCHFRWQPDFDEDGNICDLSFTGEKIGNELLIFSLIARFVRSGSRIIYALEDDGVYGMFFDGSNCVVKKADLLFD